ncbi:MAG: hypothetical protein EBR26_02220, partial [Microbacteriaceae bacterium]|nr:hypothetical protein [Microbacteriaceae bacterium]
MTLVAEISSIARALLSSGVENLDTAINRAVEEVLERRPTEGDFEVAYELDCFVEQLVVTSACR